MGSFCQVYDHQKIRRIVWDKADGYPKHAWGYEQWSIRSYELGFGCDSTVDENVHLIAWSVCESLGLDYPAPYDQAYSWDKRRRPWLKTWRATRWKQIATETIVPSTLSSEILRGVLRDLSEINNSSLVTVLEDEFEKLGYDIAEWWERSPRPAWRK